MGDFFGFKSSEYIISNPDKTDKFYYGKINTHGAFPLTDPALIKIYNNPYITETSLSKMMKRITLRKKKILRFSFLGSLVFTLLYLPVSFLFPIVFSWFYLFIVFPFFFFLFYLLLHRLTNIIMLRYSLKGKKAEFYEEIIHHLSHLIYADKIWHVNTIVPNRNLKDFGGVKQIYHRSIVKIKKTRPFFIDSNITIYNISYGSVSLYFLPDCILVQQRGKFSYYQYTELFLYYTEKPSLERKNPPGDANVIGHKWLHPNKNGSKDKRYKYNPQIPLLLLSEFLIYFKGGFQTYLQLSNSRITLGFFSFLSLYAEVAHKRPYQPKTVKRKHFPSGKDKQEKSEFDTINEKQESNHYSTKEEEFKTTETQNTQSRQLDSTTIKAFRMLGVLPGTPLIDVKRNYRLLVKQYHPDLFVQNHELMKKFTEKKIRDINKAYDHIVKWFSL